VVAKTVLLCPVLSTATSSAEKDHFPRAASEIAGPGNQPFVMGTRLADQAEVPQDMTCGVLLGLIYFYARRA
jgi:hypothetical protein